MNTIGSFFSYRVHFKANSLLFLVENRLFIFLLENNSQEKVQLEDEQQNDNEGEFNENDKISENSNEDDPQKKSDQPQSQRQSGEGQNKLTAATSRKCFNKLCPSKKIYKKIRSRVQAGKYRFLCKACYDHYSKDYYCEFCEQIYSPYENDETDSHKWIGCDTCQRWNHVQCERKFRDKNITSSKENIHYQCLLCSKKNRTTTPTPQQPKQRYKKERQILQKKQKLKQQIPRQDRLAIFDKKISKFEILEGLLQTYNFRLFLNDNLVREDIENLRLRKQALVDGKPKKRIKVD